MTTRISSDNIQTSTLATIGGGPTISNVQVTNASYVVLDDTAVNTTGGYIKITGTKFASGVQVYFGYTLATSVSLVSDTVLNVQVPAKAAGTYDLYVVNSDGSFGIKPNGITFSPNNITWVTGSTLSSQASDLPISIQLDATNAIGYQLQTGSTLPTGLTLSSGGLLSGTATVQNNTNYSFTIEAYDAELQEVPRTFSMQVQIGTPTSTVEYLVVAGGGSGGGTSGPTGGGHYNGGGGGAGGFRTSTLSVSAGTLYTVTVGAGGASVTSGNGNNGSNSVFATITSNGGGYGGQYGTSGGSGGSGGGSGRDGGSGGSGTAGQGNNGGTQPGGGGGASAVGGSGGSCNGGNGTASSISGTSVVYAGGGGGAATGAGTAGNGVWSGGDGGGGFGKNSYEYAGPAGAGTTNTGGGGGGSGVGYATGAGGSGIVIIRYPDTYLPATATTGSPTITVTGGYRIYKFTGSGSITF